MDITINVTDGVPIYRQIVNQVKYYWHLGCSSPAKSFRPSERSRCS